jgi:uncharacterized protein with von Willebrand factor type A (vWA) domain
VSSLADNVLVFGRLLRRAGIEVHVGRLLDLAEALTHVDLGFRDEVFHACRALLVHRQEQYAAFERVFDAFWNAHPGLAEAPGETRDDEASPDRPPTPTAEGTLGVVPETPPGEPDENAVGVVRTWSDAERLSRRRFDTFTEDELRAANDALARLRWTPGARRTRRWVRGRGPRIDLRRAFAQSLRTRGEIVTLPTRRRLDRPRRLILLCDVSGSMERYARLLIHFAHALGRRHDRLEVFLFSTGLTRVTPALRHRRADEAAAVVADADPHGDHRQGRRSCLWRACRRRARPRALDQAIGPPPFQGNQPRGRARAGHWRASCRKRPGSGSRRKIAPQQGGQQRPR